MMVTTVAFAIDGQVAKGPLLSAKIAAGLADNPNLTTRLSGIIPLNFVSDADQGPPAGDGDD